MKLDYLYYLCILIISLLGIPASILGISYFFIGMSESSELLFMGIVFLLLQILAVCVLFSERSRKLEFFKRYWWVKIIVFSIICILIAYCEYDVYSKIGFLRIDYLGIRDCGMFRGMFTFPYYFGYSFYGFITPQLASLFGYVLALVYLYALSTSYVVLATRLGKRMKVFERFRKKSPSPTQPADKTPGI